MTESQEPKGQEQDTDMILAKSGKPFTSTSQAMLAFATKHYTTLTHDIVPVEGGFAIKRIEAGSEGKPPEGAIESEPETETTPVTTDPVPDVEAEVEAEATGPKEEKVHWVMFADKSNEQEQEKVVLTVNHDTLVVGRMKRVPLPDRFIECARNASRPSFRQLPGEARKVTGHVHTYPFTVFEEATWGDYREMREAGTKQSREQIKNDGVQAQSV